MFNDQPATASAEAAAEATASDPTTVPLDGASAEQLEQLLVLSQAPLSLEEALEEEAAKLEEPAAAEQALTAGGLIAQYAQLVAQLLGVGLVTASVRHYADNPKLYLGVATAGALLFAVVSTFVGRRSSHDSALAAARFAGLSLLLAIGLGLLVGGALHFTAFPHTGAVLVPLGLGLSVGAFVLRDGGALVGRGFISTAVTIVGVLVWLGVGLGLAAKKLDPAPPTPAAQGAPAAGDHGAAPAGDHGAAAGGHEAAAKDGAHGQAPATGHGDGAAADHAVTAEGAHGEPAAEAHGAKAAHGDAAAAKHGAAAGSDHAAKDEHGAATTDHGATKSDHGAAAKSDHGAAATAEHGASATKGHDADAGHASASAGDDAEDEVTAADVLVSRKH